MRTASLSLLMEFSRHASVDTLFQTVEEQFLQLVEAVPRARVLLPAGRTPVDLYRRLSSRVHAGELDSSGLSLFQLDEMVGVPPEDETSFHFQLLSEFGHLAPPANRHFLNGSANDPAVEIARHADRLEREGGADLAVLGLGINGHVAFNEPGSTRNDRARVVELHAESRRTLNKLDHGAEVEQGITLGLREICAARQVWLLVVGESKADVLAELLTAEPSPGLPASLLLDHPRITIFADADAAPHPPQTEQTPPESSHPSKS